MCEAVPLAPGSARPAERHNSGFKVERISDETPLCVYFTQRQAAVRMLIPYIANILPHTTYN